jgi:hypothetical protein
VLSQPPEVAPAVRRIHDQQEARRLALVRDQVVDDAAALVRQQRVLRLAGGDAVEVVREERLQQLARPRPLDLELPHVRDVERARVRAHSPVLGDDALVLDRHLPAGERHEARAKRDVALVEGRPQQGLHRRLMLMEPKREPPRLRLGSRRRGGRTGSSRVNRYGRPERARTRIAARRCG